jgi:hypothetical protein
MTDLPIRTIDFETHPDRCRHRRLDVHEDRDRLVLDVDNLGGLDPAIEMKGNSYDLSVDIELAVGVQDNCRRYSCNGSPSNRGPAAISSSVR